MQSIWRIYTQTLNKIQSQLMPHGKLFFNLLKLMLMKLQTLQLNQAGYDRIGLKNLMMNLQAH